MKDNFLANIFKSTRITRQPPPKAYVQVLARTQPCTYTVLVYAHACFALKKQRIWTTATNSKRLLRMKITPKAKN